MRRSQRYDLGIAIELCKIEKLSFAPVFPLQALSASGEQGLMMMIRWWMTGLLVSFYEGNS